MTALLKPGDTFLWNGRQVVVKHPYEFSVLCTEVGRSGGIFGVHVSEIPCPICGGNQALDFEDKPIDPWCASCSCTGCYQQVINNLNESQHGAG